MKFSTLKTATAAGTLHAICTAGMVASLSLSLSLPLSAQAQSGQSQGSQGAQGQGSQGQEQGQKHPEEGGQGHPRREPPPQAYVSCKGKKDGDVVQITTPREDKISATCTPSEKGLFARPARPPRPHDDEKGSAGSAPSKGK